MICVALRNKLCNTILVLTNKGKNINSDFTKLIAKDILALVSCEYPLSRTVLYEKELIRANILAMFKTIGFGMGTIFMEMKEAHEASLAKMELF